MKIKSRYKIYKTTLLLTLVTLNTLFSCVHTGQQLNMTKNNTINSDKCYVTLYDDTYSAQSPEPPELYNHKNKLCKGTKCFYCKKEHDQQPRLCNNEICYWCSKSYWSRAKKICLATNKPKAMAVICVTSLCLYIYYYLYYSSVPSDSANNSMIIDDYIYNALEKKGLSIKDIQDLGNQGKNINAQTPSKGDTLAILAAKSKNMEVLQFINNNGGNINEINHCSRSAFHYASGNKDMIRFFTKLNVFRPCPGLASQPIPSYCSNEPALVPSCQYETQ